MKLLPPENQTSWAFSYLSMLVLWAPPTRMLFPQEFTGLTPLIHLCITLKVITSKLTSPTILSKHQPHHSSALAFTLCGWVWYLQKFTLAFSCKTWAAQLQDTTTSLHPKGMIMEGCVLLPGQLLSPWVCLLLVLFPLTVISGSVATQSQYADNNMALEKCEVAQEKTDPWRACAAQ